MIPSTLLWNTLYLLASRFTGSSELVYWIDTSTSSCMTSSVVGMCGRGGKSQFARFLSRDLGSSDVCSCAIDINVWRASGGGLLCGDIWEFLFSFHTILDHAVGSGRSLWPRSSRSSCLPYWELRSLLAGEGDLCSLLSKSVQSSLGWSCYEAVWPDLVREKHVLQKVCHGGQAFGGTPFLSICWRSG